MIRESQTRMNSKSAEPKFSGEFPRSLAGLPVPAERREAIRQ